MLLIGLFMATFSAGLAVFFAFRYGIVRFHLEVMALLTAAVVLKALSLLTGDGAFDTILRGLASLSLITVFVMSCDKALHAWIHYKHAREARGTAADPSTVHPAE